MRFGTSAWAAALEELELALALELAVALVRALAVLDDCAEQLQPEIARTVTAASNPTTTNNTFFLMASPFLATIAGPSTLVR